MRTSVLSNQLAGGPDENTATEPTVAVLADLAAATVAPASQGAAMTATTLVDRILDAHRQRDVSGLVACYEPHATVHPAGWPEPVDIATWCAALPLIWRSFPDLDLRALRLAADGGLAAIEIRMTGTNDGPFILSDIDRLILGTDAIELPATRQAIDVTGIVMLQIDTLVTGERHYWPAVDGLVQLGLARPRPAPDGWVEAYLQGGAESTLT